jgi:hypothetical protein
MSPTPHGVPRKSEVRAWQEELRQHAAALRASAAQWKPSSAAGGELIELLEAQGVDPSFEEVALQHAALVAEIADRLDVIADDLGEAVETAAEG